MRDRAEYLRRVLAAIGNEPHAVIGAQALMLHGLARQTDDIDLLVATPAVLDPKCWGRSEPAPVLRKAVDPGDPLDGVAALEPETDDDGAPLPDEPTAVEVIVLDRPWAKAMLARATATGRLGGVEVPVVDLADLAILKAYAGGPMDRADVAAMMTVASWASVRALVEERLTAGPKLALRNWRAWMQLLDPPDLG